jgi:phospholipid/cholesterol/gamma-HCH transport system substrate-binding protein
VKLAIQKHWKDVLAIIGLIVVSTIVGGYILSQQRLRLPFIDEAPFRMAAELNDVHGVTPGQGQTVEVSGVKVGRIGNTRVRNGRAIVELELFPQYADLVKEDARALLRPRTGLKDMFLDVDPGSPDAKVVDEGFTIPIERTLTDVDLDEVLETLDQDTREYVQLLVNGTAEGLSGRGNDLAELFRRYGPTVRDLRRVNEGVAKEREAIKDAVHGLALLSEELAGKDDELGDLVDASAAVFRAFASEDRNVAATLDRLPGTLRQATRTMGSVREFARELRPTSTALIPTFRALEDASDQVTPNARAITPVLRSQIRPFVRESQPLVSDLQTAAGGVSRALPDFERVGGRLNNLLNMLAFNPNGREDAGKAGREEGYLFWLAWTTHQAVNLFNIDDANGPLRPIFLTGTCETLISLVNDTPELEGLQNLTPILASQCGNPSTTSVDVDKVKQRIARARKSDEGKQK